MNEKLLRQNKANTNRQHACLRHSPDRLFQRPLLSQINCVVFVFAYHDISNLAVQLSTDWSGLKINNFIPLIGINGGCYAVVDFLQDGGY